ncbi:4722_t:CDS:2 [Entrophospora sp. SA101]|nr:4722_t:CDS:2 [Entrophospora sp. SA101]
MTCVTICELFTVLREFIACKSDCTIFDSNTIHPEKCVSPYDLYNLSTACKYFRNLLWSKSDATQIIWKKSRISFLKYPELDPPFGLTEQKYIWLTLLADKCQFCGGSYEKFYYEIWPSMIICCGNCFGEKTIQLS